MIVLYNAKIYTLDESNAFVDSIIIDRGLIQAVGSWSILRENYEGKPQVQLLDAAGSTIIPGLVDSHIHLENYALALQKVDCETSSKKACLTRIADRIHSTPAATWVLGHGWNQNSWAEGMPTCGDLDSLSNKQPIYLTAKSLHAAWANSTALQLANITANTPDPPGGKIGRDSSGKPDGILYESAMSLVAGNIPALSPVETAKILIPAFKRLASLGLTGVHDFDRRTCFLALQMLQETNQLPLRVIKSIPLEDLSHAISLGLSSGFGNDFLRIGSVKGFADGALGPRTAAMLQPYQGEPDNRGMLLMDAEEILESGRRAVENGLSLAIHAIGDRANHEVLDAYQELRAYEYQLQVKDARFTSAKLRHRIEHVQVLHPDDAYRLGKLDVIASMQPIHATSDMNMADLYWGERSALAYGWRMQINNGATLAFGSDAPVEPPNPFWGLHAAVSRRRHDGTPGDLGWYPDQKISRLEATKAYTQGPAYAAGMENRSGKLLPGFLADLIILPIDPFYCPTDEIKNIRPSHVMVGGQFLIE